MGFMDKAKEAAQKAAASAQSAANQGTARINQYQQSQAGGGSAEQAFAALGRAFYAEQRQGGSTDAVNAALQAVDAALAPPAPGYPDAGAATAAPTGVAAAPPAPSSSAAPQAGNFTLDDL